MAIYKSKFTGEEIDEGVKNGLDYKIVDISDWGTEVPSQYRDIEKLKKMLFTDNYIVYKLYSYVPSDLVFQAFSYDDARTLYFYQITIDTNDWSIYKDYVEDYVPVSRTLKQLDPISLNISGGQMISIDVEKAKFLVSAVLTINPNTSTNFRYHIPISYLGIDMVLPNRSITLGVETVSIMTNIVISMATIYTSGGKVNYNFEIKKNDESSQLQITSAEIIFYYYG